MRWCKSSALQQTTNTSEKGAVPGKTRCAPVCKEKSQSLLQTGRAANPMRGSGHTLYPSSGARSRRFGASVTFAQSAQILLSRTVAAGSSTKQ